MTDTVHLQSLGNSKKKKKLLKQIIATSIEKVD